MDQIWDALVEGPKADPEAMMLRKAPPVICSDLLQVLNY